MAKTKPRARSWIPVLALSFTASALLITTSRAQDPRESSAESHSAPFVVFLGTGTPGPTPNRQGPSLAVVAGGKAYLTDVGVGVVRQADAAFANGVRALDPSKLDIAFVSHLHSDHTLGLPDLILTPWVLGRTAPLELYGHREFRPWLKTFSRPTRTTFTSESPGWNKRIRRDTRSTRTR